MQPGYGRATIPQIQRVRLKTIELQACMGRPAVAPEETTRLCDKSLVVRSGRLPSACRVNLPLLLGALSRAKLSALTGKQPSICPIQTNPNLPPNSQTLVSPDSTSTISTGLDTISTNGIK
ncbi:unnamed protein product [Leuciscus chuanchicus]